MGGWATHVRDGKTERPGMWGLGYEARLRAGRRASQPSCPSNPLPGEDSLSRWVLEGGELEMSILPGTQTPSITGVTVALVHRVWVHELVLGASLTLSEPQHCHL